MQQVTTELHGLGIVSAAYTCVFPAQLVLAELACTSTGGRGLRVAKGSTRPQQRLTWSSSALSHSHPENGLLLGISAEQEQGSEPQLFPVSAAVTSTNMPLATDGHVPKLRVERGALPKASGHSPVTWEGHGYLLGRIGVVTMGVFYGRVSTQFPQEFKCKWREMWPSRTLQADSECGSPWPQEQSTCCGTGEMMKEGAVKMDFNEQAGRQQPKERTGGCCRW